MNSTASFRLVLVALALLAGVFVSLCYVTVNAAVSFQLIGGFMTIAGLLAVLRRDYSPRKYYATEVVAKSPCATQRTPAPVAVGVPVFDWNGHTVSA